jgi:putative addiction module killer protein
VRTVLTTEAFDSWLSDLRDGQGRARIQARIDRAAAGNLGTCAPVGEGVSEMKIDVGPGYRVYFVLRGLELIILLAGGDKSTQEKDIALAKELARQL